MDADKSTKESDKSQYENEENVLEDQSLEEDSESETSNFEDTNTDKELKKSLKKLS